MYSIVLLCLGFFALVTDIRAGTVCYDHLGCFSDGPPFWDAVYRPVPHLPWSPEEIGTEFWLFTRSNRNTHQSLSYNNIRTITNSNYNSGKDTKVLVHGFNSAGESAWVLNMKDHLLDVGDFNIIVVNWEKGADPNIYGQAAANTRVVGAEIGYLITIMKENYNAKPGEFHIIGHSLGGHTGGYAGQWLSANEGLSLGRISGMDAAGPYFEGTDPIVRLDPTDALFVDAIHTDSDPILDLGFGIYEPVGHVDFYPNGGKDQPGCPGSEIDEGAWWKISCSHSRVHELYIDSIVHSNQPMKGYTCSSYAAYQQGSCPNCPLKGCPAMGYYANLNADSSKVNVKYYLDTGSKAPYAET